MSRPRHDFFPPSSKKMPAPEHGIRVKEIGSTWWGQRWIEALDKISRDYAKRLARGRTYARTGRVHDLEVTGGEVTARVTGSRPTPYEVHLEIVALPDATWSKLVEALSSEAIFSAQLLAGEMPRDIDQAFERVGASLFPGAMELTTECSCPDWANPCKHVAAAHYVLGEAFDRDPFLLFELRGRARRDVLDALRRARGGPSAKKPARSRAARPRVVTLAGVTPETYERPRAPLVAPRYHVEPPPIHAAVLRQLGEPPSWSLREPPGELLSPLYEAAGNLARRIALGEPEDEAGAGSPTRRSR